MRRDYGPSFAMDGKVALVTGAARGLGLEMAKALGLAGAEVYLNGRDRAALEQSVADLGRAGVSASPACFSVEDETGASAAMGEIVARHGRLDVLVNNVGARLRADAADIDRAAFSRLIDVNLTAAYALSREAVRHMPPGGRIIMLASVMGMLGRKGDPAYIAAKGGLIALTRALACEYGERQITCNAIVPGSFATETNLPALQQPGSRERLASRLPLGRVGEPHEIAGPALFLASAASSYVTGAVVAVDGGWLASL